MGVANVVPMSAQPAPTGPIVVAYTSADTVWALWLQQLGVDSGFDLRLHRIEPGAGLPDRPDYGTLVLVISDGFVRTVGFSPDGWAGYAADPRGLLAVVVASAEIPAAMHAIPAADLRQLPDEKQARTRIRRALGRTDPTVPRATLGPVSRTRVRYPNQQMFVDYQSTTVPQHQWNWFYGRARELEAVRERLDISGAAVLTGEPGCGKTSIAAAYVHRFRSQYDIIAWISGGNDAVMRTELGRLAGPLGLPDSLPRATRHRDVVAALRVTTRRYLLVYDNVVPDHHRPPPEQMLLPSNPALLSEIVPWDGSGHILLTSKTTDWDSPSSIPVPMFTSTEGGDFLRRHIDIDEGLARQFSVAVDGSPVLLNALARRGSRGTSLDETLLEQVRAEPFASLRDESYRRTASIVGDSLRPFLDEPVGSDAWAAGQLLRLLTAFTPDQGVSLDLLTSRLPGTNPAGGTRLPAPLAEALTNEQRRKTIVDLAIRDSVAQICTDPLVGHGTALKIHLVPWHGIHDFLPRDVSEANRHTAHQLLCDADPNRTDLPALWNRYLWLWHQVEHTGALDCPRVADPDDPCSQLPELTRHIVKSLRVQGELTAAASLGRRAARLWSRLLGDTHIDVVRIRIVTGNVLWQRGEWERAHEVAAAALAGVADQRDRYPEEYVWAADLLAACMRMAGDWAGGIAVHEQSYERAREYLGESNIETVRAAHNLAVAYRMMGRFADAMTLDAANYQRFQNDPALASDPILRLHCVNNVARDHRELGNYEVSVALQERVVDDFLDLLGSRLQQNVLRARKNLAVSYRKAGRYADALRLQYETFTDHLKVYGPDHPESIAARTNTANDYRMTGDAERALEFAAEAYRRYATAHPTHPYTAVCAVNHAAALRLTDRYEEALTLDREAVGILTARLSANHPYTLAAQTGVASDLAGLGRVAEAAELGTEVLSRSRRVRGADHPYTLQSAINLGLDLRALGQVEEADALEQDALDRYAETLGTDHPDYRAAKARIRGVCDIEPPPM